MRKMKFNNSIDLLDKRFPKSILAMGGTTYNTSFRMGMNLREIYLCPMTPYCLASMRMVRRKL